MGSKMKKKELQARLDEKTAEVGFLREVLDEALRLMPRGNVDTRELLTIALYMTRQGGMAMRSEFIQSMEETLQSMEETLQSMFPPMSFAPGAMNTVGCQVSSEHHAACAAGSIATA